MKLSGNFPITLWDERLPNAYADKDWNFATLLRMIRGKKWDALKERFESPGKDPWPTKLRACRLILGLPKNDAWTKAEINIYTGDAVIYSRRGKVVCLFADVVTATASSVRPTPCFPASASSWATRFADGSSMRWGLPLAAGVAGPVLHAHTHPMVLHMARLASPRRPCKLPAAHAGACHIDHPLKDNDPVKLIFPSS